MKNKTKENIIIAVVLLLLAVFFFVGAGAFNFFTQKYSENGDFVKWTSPDETANYIFTKLYGQEGRLTINEDYNLRFDDVMHPRSFRSDRGVLKPVSFLGIILLYGKIVSLTSYKILPFITPALAALGIIFYYLLVRKIFNQKIALISSIFLAFLPPYLYYSARSMFHNVPFVVFLIMALYFIILAFAKKEKQKFLDYKISLQTVKFILFSFLGGLCLGLSITMRASELMWIAPILFLALLLNIKRVNILNLPFIVFGLLLSLLPFFYHNQVLYGALAFGGYPEMNQSISDIISVGADAVKGGEGSFFLTLRNNIFRFGFHEKFSLEMLTQYFVKMFDFSFLVRSTWLFCLFY